MDFWQRIVLVWRKVYFLNFVRKARIGFGMVFSVAFAIVTMAGCTGDSRNTELSEGTSVQISQCESENVMQPRTCEVTCQNGMPYSLVCSGEDGAAAISRPDNVKKCLWKSPWSKPKTIEVFIDEVNGSRSNVEDGDSVRVGGKSYSFGTRCRAGRNFRDGECEKFMPLLSAECKRKEPLYFNY